MSAVICTRAYGELPFDMDAALRYAGCRASDEEVRALMTSCAEEALPVLSYRVCFCTVPVTVEGDAVTFPFATVESRSLARHVAGCDEAVLFAATVGLELDRLIFREGHLSPARAVCLQAIGAERIEAVCDRFQQEMGNEYGAIRTRFSPGYGDLPLAFQRDLFRILDCQRAIGLTLNESMLMSPSKSVTAVIGVERREGKE